MNRLANIVGNHWAKTTTRREWGEIRDAIEAAKRCNVEPSLAARIRGLSFSSHMSAEQLGKADALKLAALVAHLMAHPPRKRKRELGHG